MNQLLQLLLFSNKTPRVIDRRTHAVLDYLTTGYFLCLAGYFWGRNRGATATALINAIAVLQTSMFTDYPGALRRVIPFETHGKIDVAQAALAAGLPVLFGFAGSSAAVPFQLQSMNELAVVSMTDWESPEQFEQREHLERAS